jgi:hypothetical protein
VVGRQIEVVLDRDEGPAGVLDALEVIECVTQGSTEAIQPGDDDPAAQPALDALDRFHQQGPVGPAAGLIKFLEEVEQPSAVELAPRFDALALEGGRDEARTGPAPYLGDTDVAVEP